MCVQYTQCLLCMYLYHTMYVQQIPYEVNVQYKVTNIHILIASVPTW